MSHDPTARSLMAIYTCYLALAARPLLSPSFLQRTPLFEGYQRNQVRLLYMDIQTVSVMRKVWCGVGFTREETMAAIPPSCVVVFLVSVYFPICHYYHLFLRLFPAFPDCRTCGFVFQHASMKCTYLVFPPLTSLSPWHTPRVSPFALFPNLANT